MDAAVVGIIGVVAGALATSGTQLWTTARQRHNDALAASRVTWGALADALATIKGSVESGTWVVAAAPVMERGLVVWDENRLAVARSIDAFEYRTLEVAFLRLRETLEQAGSFDADGLTAVSRDPRLREDLYRLERGEAVALRGGQTRWQRMRYPQKKKKTEAEAKAALLSNVLQIPDETVSDGEQSN